MPLTLFDHDKLDVYQLEHGLISWPTDLFDDARGSTSKCIEQGKAMLLRMVSKLTKLVDQFDVFPGATRTRTNGGCHAHA